MPFDTPLILSQSAATAVVVAAAAIAAAQETVTTAVAQQQDDQNDPANITAAETIIVTHNPYLQNSIFEHQAHSMVFRSVKKVQTDFASSIHCRTHMIDGHISQSRA